MPANAAAQRLSFPGAGVSAQPGRRGVFAGAAVCAAATAIKLLAAPRSDDVHLREGGIDISGVMVGANWFRADDRGFLLVDYFFPPGAKPGVPDTPAAWRKEAALADARTAAYLAELQAWTLAWTPLLESGADDKLTAGAVADVAARHPI